MLSIATVMDWGVKGGLVTVTKDTMGIDVSAFADLHIVRHLPLSVLQTVTVSATRATSPTIARNWRVTHQWIHNGTLSMAAFFVQREASFLMVKVGLLVRPPCPTKRGFPSLVVMFPAHSVKRKASAR